MKKYLILIAGPPATGKSYLVDLIEEVYTKLYKVTPDEFKEDIYDSQGFNSLKEKEQIEKIVWESYYSALNAYMAIGKKVILSEYPFSDKQRDKLNNLCLQFDYRPITIRLIAEFSILWNRRYLRDREKDRHLGHIMSHYHYGDKLDERDLADNHITEKEFYDIINKRNYNHFQLGELFEYDVNDFSRVDYSPILNYLSNLNF